MKLLVCCANGMSSSLLVQKMREEVKQRSLSDIKIGACAMVQLDRYLQEADVLLIAPQIGFVKKEIEKQNPTIRIIEINGEAYGTFDVSHILDEVLQPTLATNKIQTNKKCLQTLKKLANRIVSNRFLSALSSAFTSLIPVTVLGSIFLLLNNLPFHQITMFFQKTGIYQLLTLGSATTIDLISVYLSFFIAYHYIKSYQIVAYPGGLLSMICFFVITIDGQTKIPTTYLGTNGLFGCIFISWLVAFLYTKMMQRPIYQCLSLKIPQQVYRSLNAIFPSLVIITIVTIIAWALQVFFHYDNLHTLLYETIQSTLMKYISNNIITFIFFQLMTNALWFFGIHGGNVISAITNPIYIPLALENFSLYQSGQAPKHIISNVFSKCFISGGVGSMFSLALIMTIFAKSERYKTLGKIALPTTFFYINEPLIFGIPIVLNPLFFIPLMIITPFLALLTYLVMQAGIVPIPIGVQLPWTTPPIFYGFLQGSWKIACWEVVSIIIAGLIWYPFFKVADKKAYQEEHQKKRPSR